VEKEQRVKTNMTTCIHPLCPYPPMYGDVSRPIVSKEIPVCNLCYERMGSPKTLEEFAAVCYSEKQAPVPFLSHCFKHFDSDHPVRVAARRAARKKIDAVMEALNKKGKAV
jgi:hypothetical protein